MIPVLRPGGTLILSDIVNRHEYLAAVTAHQMQGAKLIMRSVWRDSVLWAASFGSSQPAGVVARKAA